MKLNVHMQMPWVKNTDDFTNDDKEKSEVRGRYFQREWFQKYEWLIYNRETNRAFCKTCARHHNDEVLKSMFGNYEVGFRNWKNSHKIASAIMGQQSISSVFSSHSLTTQQLRREGLISHFHTLKTLLSQDVPIRRNTHLESNNYYLNAKQLGIVEIIPCSFFTETKLICFVRELVQDFITATSPIVLNQIRISGGPA